MRAAVMQKLGREWSRGPASRRGDVIVLDVKRSSLYDPLTESRIGVDLARVRTPDDAVRFTQRYGLLQQTGFDSLSGVPRVAEVTEPFATFERASQDLRSIMRTHIEVRRAAREGDREALARLRLQFGPRDPDAIVVYHDAAGEHRVVARESPFARPEDFDPVSDRTVLIRASDWAAGGLNSGLLQAHAHPFVFDPAYAFPDDHAIVPGGLRIGVLPETLLGFCYLTVAQAIATEPLGTCEECQLPFVIEDARERFCTKTCGGRSRQRTFKANKANKPKGSSHGKTTRTR